MTLVAENTHCDLDFGLHELDDLSINVCRLSGVNVVLKENEMMNPFFVSVMESQLDKLDTKELYTTFKRVLIMCMKQSYNNESEAENIFSSTLYTNEFENLKKYFTLIPCSRRILSNNTQYERAVRVKKDLLNGFNSNALSLELEEIVIPMFELKEDMTRVHCLLYESETRVTNVADALSLNNYFNGSYLQRTQKELTKLILSMKESDYWTQKSNCENITMTSQFLERSLQFKRLMEDKKKRDIVINANGEFGKVIENIAKNEIDKSYQIVNAAYRPDKFVDLSSVLASQKKRTYFATVDNNNLSITKEEVTNLFKSLRSEKDTYDLFNALLISKEYCHMVLNNVEVLTLMEPLFVKFMPVYKYLIGYAWTSFYIEECLFKTRTTKDSRYVFDIRTANKLPVFPYAQDDIYQNPYLTFLVSDKVSNINNNCMTTGMYEDFSGSKIDTLEKFVWKFNLFTTGNANKNIFDGLDWKNKYAVSGSMIPAFISTKPPLFDTVVNKNDPEDKQWLDYYKYFYTNSDSDFMSIDESVFDFIDGIANVIQIVHKNLNLNVNPKDEVKVVAEPIKSTTIVLTEQFLTEKLNDIREYIGNKNLTMAELVVGLEVNNIKEYFYGIYTDLKRKNNRFQRNTLKGKSEIVMAMYEDYFKISSMDEIKLVVVNYEIGKEDQIEKDSESYIYLNDVRSDDSKVTSDKNIMIFKVSENIKFKIRSAKLLHCIEAFRAKSKDFFAVVGRFHFPCVRGYYNGETVYLEPSCITANMTHINIDYKYFASIRDPIEILNKYRSRGFATILNTEEKQHMLYYNTNVPEVAKMFDIDAGSKSKDASKNIFGYKDISNNIYKVAHFTEGFALDTYKKIDKKQLKTIKDLEEVYVSKCNYNASTSGLDLFKFKTINSEGNINPLQKWVMEAAWHILNK